jgi:hypothetical protein
VLLAGIEPLPFAVGGRPLTHARQLREEIAACEDQLREATRVLAARLLPSLDQSTLDRCRLQTGLDFLNAQLLQHLAQERTDLEHQKSCLEKHPQYEGCPKLHAELHAEEQGRLSSHRAALIPFLRACEGHPRFARLLRSGYGTARYDTPFWRLSFYSDRAAATELCQRTGKKSWAALLHDYETAAESYEVLSERLRELSQVRPRTPREEWESLERRLQSLSALHLQTAQSRLQLALLKGGEIWSRLQATELESSLHEAVLHAGLLHDQLQELRMQRTLGAQR